MNRCQTQATQEKLGRGFGKNAGEWTGRVEISKEEILGSIRVIKNLYNKAISAVLFNSNIGDWFRTTV